MVKNFYASKVEHIEQEEAVKCERPAPRLQQTRVTQTPSHNLLTSYLDMIRDGSRYLIMLQPHEKLCVVQVNVILKQTRRQSDTQTHLISAYSTLM